MRILVALGGNALTTEGGDGGPDDQMAAVARASDDLAALLAAGQDLLITHGNGPQVGRILVKNELAANVLPPIPLDWCGASTQGTIGFILMNALEAALQRVDIERQTAAVVTRTLVSADDPGFQNPTKPIGSYAPREKAEKLMSFGQHWVDQGDKGWRRVVASPVPQQILEAGVIRALLDAGILVIANGGGGIPVIRHANGTLHGVEAVVDKDLGAVVLGREVGADVLVLATDVEHVVIGWGTPDAKPLGRITVSELRKLAAEGHFGAGSMGPKVDAACTFVEGGGQRALITSLSRIADAVAGDTGTIVEAG
jgi:carbamate kinase